MFDAAPRLLAVAHGTASPAGIATARALVAALATARPELDVDLCFLDVATPSLADSLDDRPTIVVPLLLSTGYHVQHDIPAIVAGRTNVRVARHLGPHRLLVDVLAERLRAVITDPAEVLLVGAGSTRTGAADELAETARQLGERIGATVRTATMSADLRAATAGADAVATYLLAEGQFLDTLRDTASSVAVAAPIGVHPAVVELIAGRYDDAAVGDARASTG